MRLLQHKDLNNRVCQDLPGVLTRQNRQAWSPGPSTTFTVFHAKVAVYFDGLGSGTTDSHAQWSELQRSTHCYRQGNVHGTLDPHRKYETAEQNAQLLLENVIILHRLPRSIITDRDSRMVSQFWSTLCDKLDIKPHQLTAYHPSANGLAERTNQTMETLI